VKNCRECGGVSYVKRKTMLFIDSISVQENSGEELQGVRRCELRKEEDNAIHRLNKCSGKQW